MATTLGTKRRRTIPTQSESPAIPATATRRPGDPRIAAFDHPLVCERILPKFTGTIWTHGANEPIVYRPKSEHEVRLMARGFHPACWLPLAAAAEWRSLWYPLHDSAESIDQWRALIEAAASGFVRSDCADGLKRCDDMRAERDHDAALIVSPRAVEANKQRDRRIYDLAIGGAATYREIADTIHEESASNRWRIIDAQRCRQIAMAYHENRDLPPVPPRQNYK